MKMSKCILICAIGMSLSISATAKAFTDKVINASLIEPAKVVQLQASPELTIKPIKSTVEVVNYINVNRIEVLDYGAGTDLQVNSNKLAYRESNVITANFAKVQNQNFERMYLAS